jgi:lipopolysaccharide heptosyltransferase II
LTRKVHIAPADRLLISRTDRLGDLILALPLVQTLKARYPSALIDVLTSDYAAPILKYHPSVNGVVTVNHALLASDREHRVELSLALASAGYKAVLVLYPEKNICRIFRRAGIPVRIGTAGRFHSIYFNRRLFHRRNPSTRHESEYNLDFLKFFEDGALSLLPEIHIAEEEKSHAGRFLQKQRIGADFVVIHPGSGGSAQKWPLDNFLRLYDYMVKSGIETVITGSKEEGAEMTALAKKKNIAIKEITGKTDLRMLAAVLARARAMVANSTGPLHLAAAVGTKVIGLYPRNRIMSPVRWGPLGKGHLVVQPPEEGQKMDSITIEQVAESLQILTEDRIRDGSILK